MNSAPGYLRLGGEALDSRARSAKSLLSGCRLCPRACGVDRVAGEKGYCWAGPSPFVSSFGPHFGEEPPITGFSGSGTIFFGYCNLGCVFCQNWEISHRGDGEEVSEEDLAGMMLRLQRAGCHNINLVTPTHQMPAILGALCIAARAGLNIPIVYNTGGYDSIEALRLLDGIVDIYMPDLKFTDPDVAARLANARDYPEQAMAAIKEMHRQAGELVTDEFGVAIKGLLIRHLVLPDGLAGTAEAMNFIARELSPETYVNVMDQYYPCYKARAMPPLDRRLTKAEFSEAVRLARKAGLSRGILD